MKNKRASLNDEFVIFYNFKNEYPTILNKNEDLSIEAFAVLCIDCEDIPDIEFIEVVGAQANAKKDSSAPDAIDHFNYLLTTYRNMYKLLDGKIQRNEFCPCGSKKKYKFCHGEIPKANAPIAKE